MNGLSICTRFLLLELEPSLCSIYIDKLLLPCTLCIRRLRSLVKRVTFSGEAGRRHLWPCIYFEPPSMSSRSPVVKATGRRATLLGALNMPGTGYAMHPLYLNNCSISKRPRSILTPVSGTTLLTSYLAVRREFPLRLRFQCSRTPSSTTKD